MGVTAVACCLPAVPQGQSVAGGLCSHSEIRGLPLILLGINEGVVFIPRGRLGPGNSSGLAQPGPRGSDETELIHKNVWSTNKCGKDLNGYFSRGRHADVGFAPERDLTLRPHLLPVLPGQGTRSMLLVVNQLR